METETIPNACAAAVADVELWTERVREAKRVADEMLARAEEAPEPHVTTNTIYVARYEAYLDARRDLSAAMRELDAARARLRAVCCSSHRPA